MSSEAHDRVEKLIAERKFIPGGRYLYSTGRAFAQTQNCFSGDTRIITREGVKDLQSLVDTEPTLLSDHGNWAQGEVKSFGVQPLMRVTLQRSGRTKEIYATADHDWWIAKKGTAHRKVKTQDLAIGENPAEVYESGEETRRKKQRMWRVINVEETDRVEEVFCAVVPDTHKFVLEDNILTGNCALYKAGDSREEWGELLKHTSCALMSGAGVGVDYSDVRPAGADIHKTGGLAAGPISLMHVINESGRHFMQGGARRCAIWAGLPWWHDDVEDFIRVKDWSEEVVERKALDYNYPGPLDMTNVSVQLDDKFFEAYDRGDSKARHIYQLVMEYMLRTAEPGISVDVGHNKGETLRNAPIAGNTMILTSEGYKSVKAIVDIPVTVWTGQQWAEDVVFTCTKKNTRTVEVQMTKGRIVCDPTHEFFVEEVKQIHLVPASHLAPGDVLHTSSPPGEEESKIPIRVLDVVAGVDEDVYCADVKVPEHSFMAEGVIISNCTEVTSRDDSDICNLGSINLARIENIEEMKEAVYYGTLFLLAGTLYSHVPHESIERVRAKNRRLGLGLMGIHEWLLQRGKPYAPDDELNDWLKVYEESSTHASALAREHRLSTPIATRAIAPTGTIAIVGETTSGIEPILATSYKRRYKQGDITRFQFVVDPTAKRIIDAGADPTTIEDAYSIDFEHRVRMQAWIQSFVDQGVSSTINLPHPITDPGEVERLGEILYKYLPKLRGITCYPDGSRGGQPIEPVPYEEALGQEGVVFIEQEDRCRGGVCGL